MDNRFSSVLPTYRTILTLGYRLDKCSSIAMGWSHVAAERALHSIVLWECGCTRILQYGSELESKQ